MCSPPPVVDSNSISTEMVAVPLFPSELAVIVAMPVDIAVTKPSVDATATVVSLVDQVIGRSCTSLSAASFSVGVNCVGSPTETLARSGVRTTLATGNVGMGVGEGGGVGV